MKKYHFQIKTALILLTMLLFSQSAFACDWCNNKFFVELNTTRKNTLASQELLSAIYNQHDFNALREKAARVLGDAEVANIDASAFADRTVSGSNARVSDAYISANAGVPSFPAQVSGREFSSITRRNDNISAGPTSFVPQNTKPDKVVRIELQEGEVYLGNGVMYKGFTINGTIPGPNIVVDEGDVVEFKVVNKGNIPHGASIHAAYTQTSKYVGKIAPGDSASVVFKAVQPGVFLYHCAPGGHAIPMHVIYGQYGMMTVRPKQKFKLEEELGRKPDVEIFLNQHEYYSTGKDAVTGQGQPLYTAFNGKLFRYVEEPIKARPGDYVRINYMNIGPNLVSTFHIVGILWDYVYWQGNPRNMMVGGQSVTSGPTDSWVIEFRIPDDEGTYTMLSHAVGSTDRGAIGLIVVERDGDSDKVVDSQGIYHTKAQLEEIKEKAIRRISPFEPGSEDIDVPVKYDLGTEEVIVRIIGNSFYPKVIDIKPGTTVKWVNEDVFTYLSGEFSGLHNVVGMSGPQNFASPLLTHAESWSFTFEEVGEYNYICAPHPYMKGIVRVSDPGKGGRIVASSGSAAPAGLTFIALVFGFMAMVFAAITLIGPKKKD